MLNLLSFSIPHKSLQQRVGFCLATCVLLFGVFSSPSFAQSTPQQNDEAFHNATSDYAAGNFASAQKLYRQILESGEQNASVYLNLGHTEYRMGNYAQAALNYRRALALEPGNADARNSLEHSLAKLNVVAPGLNASEIVGHYIDFDILSVLGSILFWTGTAMLAFGIFADRRKKIWIILGIVVSMIGVTAHVISWMGDSRISLATSALIVGDHVKARNAPADNAKEIAALPTGTTVNLLASRDDWSLVLLPTDIEAWVKSSAIERIVPKAL